MTEHELRMLVRDAIARQLGPRGAGLSQSPYAEVARFGSESPCGAIAREARGGVSSAQFAVPSGPEGTCIIEPSVMCNHCGYCKSYGH